MEPQSNFKGTYLLDKLKIGEDMVYNFGYPNKIQEKEKYINSDDYKLLKKWINTNDQNKPPDIFNKDYNYSLTNSFKGTYLLDKLTIEEDVVYDFNENNKIEAKEDYKNSDDFKLLKKWINTNDEIKPPPPPFIAADKNDHKIELEGYCFKDNVLKKGYYSWFISSDVVDLLDDFKYLLNEKDINDYNLYLKRDGYMGIGYYLNIINLKYLNEKVNHENMEKYGYMLVGDKSGENAGFYRLDDALLENSRLKVQLENYEKLFKEFSEHGGKQNEHINTLLGDLRLHNEKLNDYENKLSVLTRKYKTLDNDLLIKTAEYNTQTAFYKILNRNLATKNNAERSILQEKISKIQEELKEKKTIIETRQREIKIIGTELQDLEKQNDTELQRNKELFHHLNLEINKMDSKMVETDVAAKLDMMQKEMEFEILQKELDAKTKMAERAAEAAVQAQRVLQREAAEARDAAAAAAGDADAAKEEAKRVAEQKLVDAKAFAAAAAAAAATAAADKESQQKELNAQYDRTIANLNQNLELANNNALDAKNKKEEVERAAAASVAAQMVTNQKVIVATEKVAEAGKAVEAAEMKAAELKKEAKEMAEKMEQVKKDAEENLNELINTMNKKANAEKNELNRQNLKEVEDILNKSRQEWEAAAAKAAEEAKKATEEKMSEVIKEKKNAEDAFSVLQRENDALRAQAAAAAEKAEAERQLQQTMKNSQTDALEAAIEAAKKAGVEKEKIDSATKRLEELKAEEEEAAAKNEELLAAAREEWLKENQQMNEQVDKVKERIALAVAMARKADVNKNLKVVSEAAKGAMNSLKETVIYLNNNKANIPGVKDKVKDDLFMAEQKVKAAMELLALKEAAEKMGNEHNKLIKAGQNGMMDAWWKSQSKLASAMLEAERVINADTTKAKKDIIEREFNDMKQKAEDAKLRATETIDKLVKFANNAKSNNRVKSLVDNIKESEKDVYITKDGTTNLNEVRINTEDGNKILNVSDFGVPIDYMKLKDFVEKINAIEEKNILESLSPEEKDTLDEEIQLIKRTKDKFERFEKMYKLLGEATQGIVNRTTNTLSGESKEWVYYYPYSKQYLEFMREIPNDGVPQLIDNSPQNIYEKQYFYNSLTKKLNKKEYDKLKDKAGTWPNRVPKSKDIYIFDDEQGVKGDKYKKYKSYSDFINTMNSVNELTNDYAKLLESLEAKLLESLGNTNLDKTETPPVWNDKWSLIANKGYFLERMYYAKLLGIQFPEKLQDNNNSINYNLYILNNGYKKLIQDLDYSNSLFQVDKKVSNWDEAWRFEVAQNNQKALIEQYETEESSKLQLKVLKDNKQYWKHRTTGRTKSTEVSHQKSQEPNKNSRSNSVEVTKKTDNNTDDRRNNEGKNMTGSKIRTASGNNSSLPSEISPLNFNTINKDAIKIETDQTEKDDTEKNNQNNQKKRTISPLARLVASARGRTRSPPVSEPMPRRTPKPEGTLMKIMSTNKLINDRARIKPNENGKGGSKTKKKLKLKKPKKIERKYKQSLKKKAKSKYSQKNKQIKNKNKSKNIK